MDKKFVFSKPNVSDYMNCKNVSVKRVEKDGVAPSGFYLTSHMPTYYKLDGKWHLPKRSSQDCVAVVKDGTIQITEFRNLKVGDDVIMGRTVNGEEGILRYGEGFGKATFLMGGDFVEASNSSNYNLLFHLMKKEKENGGYIVWVLGPAVVFDYDTRKGLSRIAKAGYVQSLLGGNAMCTHDLEAGYLSTALGQDIYTQESDPLGHYNHLDLLNDLRTVGSVGKFIDQGNVRDGFVKTLHEMGVPISLAGSIRDDGPLPIVTGNVYTSLDKTKEELGKATLVICLATTLHSAATAETCSSYRVDENGNVVPIFLYTIDVTENAVRKVIAAREQIAVRSLITNVQDFVVNLERELVPEDLTLED